MLSLWQLHNSFSSSSPPEYLMPGTGTNCPEPWWKMAYYLHDRRLDPTGNNWQLVLYDNKIKESPWSEGVGKESQIISLRSTWISYDSGIRWTRNLGGWANKKVIAVAGVVRMHVMDAIMLSFDFRCIHGWLRSLIGSFYPSHRR